MYTNTNTLCTYRNTLMRIKLTIIILRYEKKYSGPNDLSYGYLADYSIAVQSLGLR